MVGEEEGVGSSLGCAGEPLTQSQDGRLEVGEYR